MIGLTEREIKAAFLARIDDLGGLTRKVAWEGRRGAMDWLVLFEEGALVWVELKRPGQSPTPQQRREHDRFRDLGQRVVVIDSLDSLDTHFPPA